MEKIYVGIYTPDGPFSRSKRVYSFEPKEKFIEVNYAMRNGYTDIIPYEIVAIKGKRLTIRSMKCKQVGNLIQSIGGFAAHTENSSQKWEIESDPKGYTTQISLRKDGKFRQVGTQDMEYFLGDKPIKFYDYNF